MNLHQVTVLKWNSFCLDLLDRMPKIPKKSTNQAANQGCFSATINTTNPQLPFEDLHLSSKNLREMCSLKSTSEPKVVSH